MAGVVEGDCIEIRWLTGCQGLIGKCSDFGLYSIVNRKPVEVTISRDGAASSSPTTIASGRVL